MPLLYNPSSIQAASLLQRRPVSAAQQNEMLSRALMEAKEKDPLYKAAMDRKAYEPAPRAGAIGEIAKHLAQWEGEQDMKDLDQKYQDRQAQQNQMYSQILSGGEGGQSVLDGLPPQQREMISRVLQSGDSDMIQAVVGQVLQQSFEPGAQPKYEKVGNDLVKIGTDGKVEKAYSAPTERKTSTVDMVGSQGPGQYVIDSTTGEEIRKAGGIYNKPPSTVINNIDNGEKSFNKKFGENQAANFEAMITQAQQAPQTISKINEFRNITASGVPTGKVQDMTLPARQFFNSIGITDDKNIAGQEAINSIAANFVLDKFQSLKGPQTDKDAVLVASAVPQLSKTPEGNTIMLDLAERAEQYKIEMANEASKYVSQNGQLDANWISYYNQWAAQNPLLTPELRGRVQAAKSGKPAAAQSGKPKIRNITVE